MSDCLAKLKVDLDEIGYLPDYSARLTDFLADRWSNHLDIFEKNYDDWLADAKKIYDMFAPRGFDLYDLLHSIYHGALAQETAHYQWGEITFNPTDDQRALELYEPDTLVARVQLGSGDTLVIPQTFTKGFLELLSLQDQYRTEVNGEIVLAGVFDDEGRTIYFESIIPANIFAVSFDLMDTEQWDKNYNLAMVLGGLAYITDATWERYVTGIEKDDQLQLVIPNSAYKKLSKDGSPYDVLRAEGPEYLRTLLVDFLREGNRLQEWLVPDSYASIAQDAQTAGFDNPYDFLLAEGRDYLENLSIASDKGIGQITWSKDLTNKTRIHTHPYPEKDYDSKEWDHRRPSIEIGDLEGKSMYNMYINNNPEQTEPVRFEAIASYKNGIPSLTIFNFNGEEYFVDIFDVKFN